MSTDKQREALNRNSMIRSLCGIYAQVGSLYTWDYIQTEEYEIIIQEIDYAIYRIRGETETAKRKRERNEYEQEYL